MKYSLQIPCCPKKLTDVRAFIYNVLRDFSVPAQDADMIVLAVDEICANRIIHSNDCNTGKELSIIVKKKGLKLMFEISDEGIPFNIDEHYKEPCLKETVKKSKKGGLGLMLVRRIMDAVEYKKTKYRSKCLLYKTLSA